MRIGIVRGWWVPLVPACAALLLSACGGNNTAPPLAATPVSSNPPGNTVSITGTVTDRITGGPIDAATLTFALGTIQKTVNVTGGSYAIDVVPAEYLVTVSGPSNVTQETRSLTVSSA